MRRKQDETGHCTGRKISSGSVKEECDNHLQSSKVRGREMTTFYFKALLIEIIRSTNAPNRLKGCQREMDFWSSVRSSEAPDELL